jgi:hypothetical protein
VISTFSLPIAALTCGYLTEDAVATRGLLQTLEDEGGATYCFATYVIGKILPNQTISGKQKSQFVHATFSFAINRADFALMTKCLNSFITDAAADTRLCALSDSRFRSKMFTDDLVRMNPDIRLRALTLPKIDMLSVLIRSVGQPAFITSALFDLWEHLSLPLNGPRDPTLEIPDQLSFLRMHALKRDALKKYNPVVGCLVISAITHGIQELKLPKNDTYNAQTTIDMLLKSELNPSTRIATALIAFELKKYEALELLVKAGDSESTAILIATIDDTNTSSFADLLETSLQHGIPSTAAIVLNKHLNAITVNGDLGMIFEWAANSGDVAMVQTVLADPAYVALSDEKKTKIPLVPAIKAAILQQNSEMVALFMQHPAFKSVDGGQVMELTTIAIAEDDVASTFLLKSAPQFPHDHFLFLFEGSPSQAILKMLIDDARFKLIPYGNFVVICKQRNHVDPFLFKVFSSRPEFNAISTEDLNEIFTRQVDTEKSLKLFEETGRLDEITPATLAKKMAPYMDLNASFVQALANTAPFMKLEGSQLVTLFAKAIDDPFNRNCLPIFVNSKRFEDIDLTTLGQAAVSLAKKGDLEGLQLLAKKPNLKNISPLYIEEAIAEAKKLQDQAKAALIEALLTSILPKEKQ